MHKEIILGDSNKRGIIKEGCYTADMNTEVEKVWYSDEWGKHVVDCFDDKVAVVDGILGCIIHDILETRDDRLQRMRPYWIVLKDPQLCTYEDKPYNEIVSCSGIGFHYLTSNNSYDYDAYWFEVEYPDVGYCGGTVKSVHSESKGNGFYLELEDSEGPWDVYTKHVIGKGGKVIKEGMFKIGDTVRFKRLSIKFPDYWLGYREYLTDFEVASPSTNQQAEFWESIEHQSRLAEISSAIEEFL